MKWAQVIKQQGLFQKGPNQPNLGEIGQIEGKGRPNWAQIVHLSLLLPQHPQQSSQPHWPRTSEQRRKRRRERRAQQMKRDGIGAAIVGNGSGVGPEMIPFIVPFIVIVAPCWRSKYPLADQLIRQRSKRPSIRCFVLFLQVHPLGRIKTMIGGG